MRKKVILISISIIVLMLSIVLRINITQYKFSLSGEGGNYSTTLNSNFYEINYYLFNKKNSFDIGKAKFRVYFTESVKASEQIENVEVEFNFDSYFSGTYTNTGTMTEMIVKVDYGEIIRSLDDEYSVYIRTDNSPEVIEILLNK